MRGADDAIHVLLGRQRHRPYDAGTRADDGLDDLARRRVNSLMVVGLEPDADLLSRHAFTTSSPHLSPFPDLVPPGARIDRPKEGRSSVAPILRRCLPVVVQPFPPALGCVTRTQP